MKLKSRLFFLFYCLVTTLIAPLGLAFLCYKKRHDPPYGKRALELLGCYHIEFKRCIWFHTVSVGEAIAARPLIQAFVKRHPKLSVVVTTTTTTGAREISKIEGVTHVFAPLDSPVAVYSFLQHFKPSHLFIMETELWPCMLNLTRYFKTKVCVFNARMPEKTCLKYEKHKTIVQDLIANNLYQVICQTKDDAERFLRIGVASKKVFTAGSLKYDLSPNEILFRHARQYRKNWSENIILGAISTHEGEEAMILETFYGLKELYPELKLVLVPRHQSGVTRAETFLDDVKGDYDLRTNISHELKGFTKDVLVGNTMGEIEFYLGLCDLVFMGGSFADVGGHNPLEPAYFSIPIITGPNYYNFQEQFDKLIEHGGAYVANDHRRLFTVCQMFIDHKERLVETGMRAFDVQQEGRGALSSTLDHLEETLRAIN